MPTSQHHATISEPLIVAISVAVGVVLFVSLVWIFRWATRKPSTELPPPRQAHLSPYSVNRPGAAGYRSTVYLDDETKFASGTSSPLYPYGHPAPPSDSSQLALWRGPDGEYYHDRARDSYPSEAGSSTVFTNDQRLRHTPSAPSPLNDSPSLRPQSPLSLTPTDGVHSLMGHPREASGSSTSEEAVKTDAQLSFPPDGGPRHPAGSDSPSVASFPSMGMPRSRQSITASLHLPASITVPSRRLSRHSTYSVAASTQDPRRNSIRGAPHKTNMQIVLPEPLAASTARNSDVFHSASLPPEGFGPSRSLNRRSRADLWTEENTSRSRRTSQVEPMRPRRKSRESTESRSFELPASQFRHMEPPPPLPSLSRSGTPNSFSSARSETVPPPLPPPLPTAPSPAPTLADRPKPPPSPTLTVPSEKIAPTPAIDDLPPLPVSR